MIDLTQKALRYGELESRFRDFKPTGAESTEQLLQYLGESLEKTSLETELRGYLEGCDVVKTEDIRAQGILRRLADKTSDEKGSDQFLDELIEAWDDDLEERTFWSWFSMSDFLRGYLAAPPLITVVGIPRELHTLIEEARRCYGCGQRSAVVALSRTILEFAITDIGVTIGRLQPLEGKDFYAAYPPWERADLILGKGGPQRERFRRIYDDCSEVIHGSAIGTKPALAILCQTLALTADLYNANHRQYMEAKERAKAAGGNAGE